MDVATWTPLLCRMSQPHTNSGLLLGKVAPVAGAARLVGLLRLGQALPVRFHATAAASDRRPEAA